MKFGAKNDAGFEDAYLNDYVTCKDDSVHNVALDRCMSTPRQINTDLMIIAVTALKCELAKHNQTNLRQFQLT